MQSRPTLLQNLLALLIFLFLSGITFKTFLFSEGVVQYRDLDWPYHLEVWQNIIPYTSENLDVTRRLLILYPTFTIALQLNIPSSILEKLFFLTARTLMGFSAYFSAQKLLRVKSEKHSGIFAISIITGFLYAYNPFAIQFLSPAIFLSISYGLLPLIFCYYVMSLQFHRLKYMILTAFFWTLAVSSVIQLLVLVPTLLIPWLLLHLLNDLFNKAFLTATKKVGASLIILALFSLFSAYWIAPTLYSSLQKGFPSPDYVLTLETLQMFSHPLTLTNVIRLIGVWWPRVPLIPLHEQPWLWIILTFTIPIFTFSCLLLLRNFKPENKRNIIFLSITALFILFFYKGTNEPGSRVYPLLYNIPVIGWLFRVPTKLGIPLALTYTFLTAYTLYGLFKLDQSKRKSRKYLFTFSSLLLILSTSILVWPVFTGNLGGVFIPKTLSTEEQALNSWIENNIGDHKILYMSEDLQHFLLRYGGFLLTDNKTRNFVSFISPLNVKYLVFNQESANHKNILYQDGLRLVQNFSSLSVFENQQPVSRLLVPNQIVWIFGGLEKLSAFTYTDVPDFSTCGFIFIDQQVENEASQLPSDILIANKEFLNMMVPLSDEKIVVSPFDATYRHDPSIIWSRAGANDPLHGPWHLYLEQKEIENWDFDYGKGLVLTWAPSILEEPFSLKDEDLISEFYFEDKNLGNWIISTQNIQTLFLSEDAYEGAYSLKVELYNSTQGWKTINSPLIPVKYGDSYKWEFYVKGENSQNVHAKIVEYNLNRTIITANIMTSIGSGNFSWRKVFSNFAPTSTEAAYMQLQVWHGHETKQPLPNNVWIDNVKVYDLKDYVKPNTLETSFTTQTEGTYDLFIRYFQNKDGGKIVLYLDGNQIETIDTKAQISRFTWKKIGTYNLNRGKHTLTLENREGFNAVNLFTLITQEEVAELEETVESLLQNKRIIYILEAEADMYRESSSISNKYGGEASNGEVLELTLLSRIWNELEILKPGNYTILIRSKGNLNIRIDEKEYTTNSKQFDWTYLRPISLEKGQREIEITPLLTHYSQWNFEKGELEEWQGNIPEIQTLSLSQKPYEGNYSLKAELNVSTGGWKVIQSPMTPVTPGNIYKWDFYVAGENAHSVHAKIFEYDINNESIAGYRMAGIGGGNFTWKNINFEYTPHQNASYMQLQIWHGSETNQSLPNKVWIDDVKVYGSQPSDFDVIWLYSVQKENETLEDIFTPKEIPAKVMSYRKIDPTKYIVEVNATKPFMLSFAEAYDPLWVAHVNEERIESIPLYSVINGFWVNQTGQLEITIEYEPQKWFYYGSIISATTFLLCLAYLTYNRTKNKTIWKRIKNPQICYTPHI